MQRCQGMSGASRAPGRAPRLDQGGADLWPYAEAVICCTMSSWAGVLGSGRVG